MIRDRFIDAITSNEKYFGLSLTKSSVFKLADFFDLVQQHNPLLHLVAPSSPEEFAVRHILESLTLLVFLPENARFTDVGTGAGLPSIPCLIVRPDLKATLIESKEKKAKFLESALASLGLADRAKVVNRQFEETSAGEAEFVTCRALDKFTEKLPRLIKWSRGRKLLFFGGPALLAEMEKRGLAVQSKLLPLSDRRYLFASQT